MSAKYTRIKRTARRTTRAAGTVLLEPSTVLADICVGNVPAGPSSWAAKHISMGKQVPLRMKIDVSSGWL